MQSFIFIFFFTIIAVGTLAVCIMLCTAIVAAASTDGLEAKALGGKTWNPLILANHPHADTTLQELKKFPQILPARGVEQLEKTTYR